MSSQLVLFYFSQFSIFHDTDIIQFYKDESRKENSIVVLFSDHGARTGATGDFRNTKQGRLEEYTPFYSIILPPSFKSNYPELHANIKANTEVLTSHFDVHMTLKHLLSYPKLPDKMKYGQSLFTKINPRTRTCNQTGIPARYCFCSKAHKMPVDSPESKNIVQKGVDYINSKIKSEEEPKSKCSTLYLKDVISIEYMKATNSSTVTYNVIFRVSPSDATFDLRVIKTSGIYRVDPEISRTNLYRNQPACIQMKYPKLAPFCYCKSLLNNSRG